MERNDKDPRRDYEDTDDLGSTTGGGRNQLFFQPQATDSMDLDLPPVMVGASRRRSSSELQNDRVGFEQPGPQMQSQESWVRHGVQVLPVAPPRASIAAGQQQGQMRNAVPLDSSSTSGVDSASSSERRCNKIHINPSTVEVNKSETLWLALADGSGLPPRTTEVVIIFCSLQDPFRMSFARGFMGPNSLTVTVKNPIWEVPEKVTVEVRTAIEPDGRVLGVGHLQFVRPPLTIQLMSLLADASTGPIAERMHDLLQSAREGSAEGSECQRFSNIPSKKNLSTPYFICRQDDIAVKEAYTILPDQLQQWNESQERGSEVSDYTPDKRLPPKVEKKKARPHSSVPSLNGPKSSIDIPRVYQSSLEDSDGQLTDSNECSENHQDKQFAPSDSGFDEKCVETLH